jgi:hypothetical protein
MKKTLFGVAITCLVLGVSPANHAQAVPFFGVTNDDNPAGNTATVFKLHLGVLAFSQTLNTGGQLGLGGGYFATPRTTISAGAGCIFVSNAGSGTISAFSKAKAGGLVGSYGSPGLSGNTEGIGLALNPNNNVLYATYSATFNLATWTVNQDCSLKLGNIYADPLGDAPGPLAVSSDGKLLVEPDPNAGFVNTWFIGGGGLVLNLAVSHNLAPDGACPVTGCFPTGVDLSKVAGGNVTAIFGNATLAGNAAYYITTTINTGTGAVAVAADNNAPGPLPDVANIESPEFSLAAWGAGGTGAEFLGGSGFGGAPDDVGVIYGNAVAGVIPAAGYFEYDMTVRGPVFGAMFGGNISVATFGANAIIWQPVIDVFGNNNICVYGYFAGVIKPPDILCVANPNAPAGATLVLSIAAYPGR